VLIVRPGVLLLQLEHVTRGLMRSTCRLIRTISKPYGCDLSQGHCLDGDARRIY
jgi:hypothetical protein